MPAPMSSIEAIEKSFHTNLRKKNYSSAADTLRRLSPETILKTAVSWVSRYSEETITAFLESLKPGLSKDVTVVEMLAGHREVKMCRSAGFVRLRGRHGTEVRTLDELIAWVPPTELEIGTLGEQLTVENLNDRVSAY